MKINKLRVKHDANGSFIIEGNKTIARTYCRDGNATINDQYKESKSIAQHLVNCANSQHGEVSDTEILNWILGRLFVARESEIGDTWEMLNFDAGHWDCGKDGSHDMRKILSSLVQSN